MAGQGIQQAAGLDGGDATELLNRFHQGYHALFKELHRAIVGQDQVIESVLCAMLAGGHCLVQGVPGLAKTLLISSLADTLDLNFNRIQFTPDLMPGDITGAEIIQEDPDSHQRRFEFIKGPIFANIVLADEINRTPPKTQAALLQAMQEREVTVAGHTHDLPAPFFILATQNPIEQEGTYPLPEAALDRFMFMVYMDYPTATEEHEVIKRTTTGKATELRPVLSRDDLVKFQALVRSAPVSDAVIEYAVQLTRASRPTDPLAGDMAKRYLKFGAGPRSGQFMTLASKALALMNGRVTPSYEDIRYVAPMVLRHRVVTNFDAEADGVSVEEVIADIIKQVTPPA